MNNDIRCDNLWAFENDSSNHAHDGANGHEGIPEMLQRMDREAKERMAQAHDIHKDNNQSFVEQCKEIGRKLLKGEL